LSSKLTWQHSEQRDVGEGSHGSASQPTATHLNHFDRVWASDVSTFRVFSSRPTRSRARPCFLRPV